VCMSCESTPSEAPTAIDDSNPFAQSPFEEQQLAMTLRRAG
jgi:hypothetical protein